MCQKIEDTVCQQVKVDMKNFSCYITCYMCPCKRTLLPITLLLATSYLLSVRTHSLESVVSSMNPRGKEDLRFICIEYA